MKKILEKALIPYCLLLLISVTVQAAFVNGIESFDGSVKDTATWEEWIMDGVYGSVTQNDALTIASCADYTTKAVTVGIGQAVSVEVYYCPLRGMGEKPSPLGEDFSMILAWRTIVNRAIRSMISNTIWYGSRNIASRY